MTITAEEVVERQIVIRMRESDARKLKTLLMDNVDWDGDTHGRVAEQVYDALSGVNVLEA